MTLAEASLAETETRKTRSIENLGPWVFQPKTVPKGRGASVHGGIHPPSPVPKATSYSG